MTSQSTLMLTVLTYGIAIVISFLVALLIKGIYLAMNFMEHRQKQQITPPPPVTEAATEALSPELVAVISAAAVMTFGPKARIKRIHYRTGRPTTGWSQQGRMTVMTSHNVRR